MSSRRDQPQHDRGAVDLIDFEQVGDRRRNRLGVALDQHEELCVRRDAREPIEKIAHCHGFDVPVDAGKHLGAMCCIRSATNLGRQRMAEFRRLDRAKTVPD